MPRYQITNTASGAYLGEYEADSEDAALDAMARDAGYADYASIPEAARNDPDVKVIKVGRHDG